MMRKHLKVQQKSLRKQNSEDEGSQPEAKEKNNAHKWQ